MPQAPVLFRVRLIRSALIGHRLRVAGALEEVGAARALELVLDGDGLMHDPADLKRLHAALAAEVGEPR